MACIKLKMSANSKCVVVPQHAEHQLKQMYEHLQSRKLADIILESGIDQTK